MSVRVVSSFSLLSCLEMEDKDGSSLWGARRMKIQTDPNLKALFKDIPLKFPSSPQEKAVCTERLYTILFEEPKI